MDIVFRGLCVYLFLLIIIRLSARRTLGETTTFDFVLVLIIAETTQQALLGQDYSVTTAIVLITTLVGADIVLSLVKNRWPRAERLIDGLPLVIVDQGRPLEDRMRKTRVDKEDILAAARKYQGLERMDQIKYAVLESNGGISIIPKSEA
jgi:uncharacterized membrane protein YcaP (DUF421 family)